VPVAYLCIGYAQDFLDEPELQRRGWAHRLPLAHVIYHERWEGEGLGSAQSTSARARDVTRKSRCSM
jgi:hypothetical protein